MDIVSAKKKKNYCYFAMHAEYLLNIHPQREKKRKRILEAKAY